MMTEITEKLNDADHGRAVMGNSVVSWIGFNLVMLVLYLGFFYMCLAVEYPRSDRISDRYRDGLSLFWLLPVVCQSL